MAIANDKQIKQKEAAYFIELKMKKLYQEMLVTYGDIFNSVWNNGGGLTPQEVMDAMGSRAADMFEMAGLCVSTLNTAVPNTIQHAPPYTYTINDDGTVTVGSLI